VLPRKDVLNFDAPRVTHAPFVPRDHIVGQAFFIFYPPRRLTFVR